MPNYHYLCENCESEFQIEQSIKEDPIQYCSDCKTMSLRRVIHAVTVIDTTPKTLGSQAEKNAISMGREQVALKEAENVWKKKPKERPWWRPNSDSPVDLKKIKNMKKYIEEGKTE